MTALSTMVDTSNALDTEFNTLNKITIRTEPFGPRVAEAAWHRRALDRWHGPYVPKLEPDELDRCHQLFDEQVAARGARVDEHRELLARRAQWLASEVKAYRCTLADAQARLERLADQYDDEIPIAIRLLPVAEARAIVECAFAEVLR
jgi:hypothetical protein